MQRYIGNNDGMYASMSYNSDFVTEGEWQDIALFDSIIDNKDRHGGNLMVRRQPGPGERHIIAIDHGLAFPDPNSKDNTHTSYCNRIAQDRIGAKALTTQEMAALSQLVAHRADVTKELAPLLPPGAIDDLWARVDYIADRKTTISGDSMDLHPWDKKGKWL